MQPPRTIDLRQAVTLCRPSQSGSVGVISPQDAVGTEPDVMENYHLLDCSLSISAERGRGLKFGVNEVLEGGREAGALITYAKVRFVGEERLSDPL